MYRGGGVLSMWAPDQPGRWRLASTDGGKEACSQQASRARQPRQRWLAARAARYWSGTYAYLGAGGRASPLRHLCARRVWRATGGLLVRKPRLVYIVDKVFDLLRDRLELFSPWIILAPDHPHPDAERAHGTANAYLATKRAVVQRAGRKSTTHGATKAPLDPVFAPPARCKRARPAL